MKLREGFQLLSTAQDGVARLRKLILSLAVQGQLAPQDPNDEPANKLLKLIASSKAGKMSEPPHSVEDGERPVDIPKSWYWTRFRSVFSLEYGDNLPSPKRSNSGEFPVYGSNGVVGSHSECSVSAPCIVVGRKGSAGALNLCLSSGCWVTDVAYYCIPPKELDLQFCFMLFQTLGLDELGKGIKPGLSRSEAYVLPVAIPPLAEQHRIVAKVNELMRFCDELETHGRLEAEQHARLTSTLFDALAASESAHALTENWSRVAAHFDLLLDRPEAVDALEQTILQLAVRGLLVPQESNDEPASDLLKQIRTEKDRLIAEGKVKRDKPLPAITEDDKPFELPEQWEWVRTQDICAVITDGDHQAPPKAAEGVPFLVIGDVRWGSLDVASASRFVPDAYFDRLDWSKKPIAGDILYTTVGSFGIPVLVTEEMRFCFQRHIGLFRPAHITLQPFLNLVLASALVLQQASARATGIAQKTVPLSALRDFKIPLPPLAEQHRIVACVEDLHRLCADLRERLNARQTCQARLAETLVEQATSTALWVNTGALAAAA